MSKTKAGVLMMSVAFLTGSFVSITSNPLLGAAILIVTLSLWSFVPKVPGLVRAYSKK